MVVRISAVTSPLTRTPLTATFSRPVSRSKTISAPVRPSLRVAAARITSSTVRATGWGGCRPRMKRPVPSRPTWSSARRSGLEEDDHADQDRRPGVGEDELEEAELEGLGQQPDHEQHRQPAQQLHRLRPPDQLEEPVQQEGDDDDVDD